MQDEYPDELSESLVEKLVHTFYGRVRVDAVLGPIFESRVAGRWDAHLATLVDFWSSIAMKSGRYAGRPYIAHQGLELELGHFERWLGLFEQTANDICSGAAAAFFIDRARRIADSLQLGLNIKPKAVSFPAISSPPLPPLQGKSTDNEPVN